MINSARNYNYLILCSLECDRIHVIYIVSRPKINTFINRQCIKLHIFKRCARISHSLTNMTLECQALPIIKFKSSQSDSNKQHKFITIIIEWQAKVADRRGTSKMRCRAIKICVYYSLNNIVSKSSR